MTSEYPDLDWPCWEMDEEPIIMTDNSPLPVKGYTPQSDDNVSLANKLKEAEERYLRVLDGLNEINIQRDASGIGKSGQFDPRFLALARTHMQTANMFAVRSIFQPTRVKLPEDG